MQELEGSNLDCAMAQHLLVAADRFQLPRLRRICERRLCETVEVLLLLHKCFAVALATCLSLPLLHKCLAVALATCWSLMLTICRAQPQVYC